MICYWLYRFPLIVRIVLKDQPTRSLSILQWLSFPVARQRFGFGHCGRRENYASFPSGCPRLETNFERSGNVAD